MANNKTFNVENPKIMFKNSIVNLGAATFTKIFTVLLLPIYTRVLTTEEYGQMELIIILGNFLIMLYPFNFQAALGRMYFDFTQYQNKLKVFISTILLIVGISSCIQLVIYLLLGHFFLQSDNFLNINYYPFIVLILVGSSLRVYFPLVLKLLQNRGDSVISSWFTISYTMVGILLNILFIVVLRMGVVGFVYAFFVTSLIVFISTAIYLKNDLISKIDKKVVFEAISYSYPLLLSNVFLFIYQYIDRFILALSNSISDAGIYALATKIALLLSLLHVALNRVLNPYLYSHLSKKEVNKNKIIKVFNYNVVLFISIGFLLALFSKELVSLLAPDEYSSAGYIAPILILGFVFQAFYFNSVRILFFYKKTKIISVSSIIVGVINLILGFLFIPKYGSIAAATVFVITIAIHSLIIHYYSKRNANFNFKYNRLIVLIFFCSALIAITSFLNFKSNIIFILFKILLYLTFVAFVFFKFIGIYEFKKLIKSIKQ